MSDQTAVTFKCSDGIVTFETDTHKALISLHNPTLKIFYCNPSNDTYEQNVQRNIKWAINGRKYTVHENNLKFEFNIMDYNAKFNIMLTKKDSIEELSEEVALLQKRIEQLEDKKQKEIKEKEIKEQNTSSSSSSSSSSSTASVPPAKPAEDLTKYGEEIKDFVFPWQQFHEWLMNPPKKVIEVYKSTIDEYKASSENYNEKAIKRFFFSIYDSNIFYAKLFNRTDENKWALVVTFLSTIGVRIKYCDEYRYAFHKTQTKILYFTNKKSTSSGNVIQIDAVNNYFRSYELLD